MIGFVVEDNAQEKALLELRSKLQFPTQRKLINQMHGDKLRKANQYARDLISKGCHRVIVVKDLEGAPDGVERKFNEKGFPSETILFIVVREIETWFLADEEALREYLRIKVKRISEPETVADPKEYLNHKALE